MNKALDGPKAKKKKGLITPNKTNAPRLNKTNVPRLNKTNAPRLNKTNAPTYQFNLVLDVGLPNFALGQRLATVPQQDPSTYEYPNTWTPGRERMGRMEEDDWPFVKQTKVQNVLVECAW